MKMEYSGIKGINYYKKRKSWRVSILKSGSPPVYLGMCKTLEEAKQLLADCQDVGYDRMRRNQQNAAAERQQAKDDKILRQARAEVKRCEQAFLNAQARLKYLNNVETTGRIYHGRKHYKFK